MTNGLMVDFCI